MANYIIQCDTSFRARRILKGAISRRSYSGTVVWDRLTGRSLGDSVAGLFYDGYDIPVTADSIEDVIQQHIEKFL